ncbi:MAG: hypothetical protein ACP5JF_03880 [Candidatus Methanodesulfokora sp.]|jgi:hypothetical protein
MIYIRRVVRGLSFLLLGFAVSALAATTVIMWSSMTPKSLIWKCEAVYPWNAVPSWNASGITPPPGSVCRYEQKHPISEIAVPLGLCYLFLIAIWILQIADAYLLAKSSSQTDQLSNKNN